MSSGSAVLGVPNSNNNNAVRKMIPQGPQHQPNMINNNNNNNNNNLNAAKTIIKSRGGKIVLPMMVTPPKTVGPSAAEKKLEALTKQLEEEMEKEAAGGSAVMGKGDASFRMPGGCVVLECKMVINFPDDFQAFSSGMGPKAREPF